MTEPAFEIRTSARRRKTMSAYREDGRVVVVVPQRMTARQRRDLVPPLVEKFLAGEQATGGAAAGLRAH